LKRKKTNITLMNIRRIKVNEKITAVIASIALLVIITCASGCRSAPIAGDESLVEARILAAVNAERNRWTEGLAQQLNQGLREIDGRVDAIEGGLQQVAAAAREYREFVLSIIDGLSKPESESRATE
jgi:hypothetical protein